MGSLTLTGPILNLEELEVACIKLRGEENHMYYYKTKYQRKDKREMVVKKSKSKKLRGQIPLINLI